MKLIRITTIPGSLNGLLKGQMGFMTKNGFEVVAVSSPGATLEQVGVEEGVRTVAVKMTRSITPFRDLFAIFKLVKLFKQEKPDIVHTHTPKAGLLGMIAARIAGVPFRLHTVAGMPLLVATGNKRKVLDYVEKLTYKMATQVYPNSKGLEKIILDLGFGSKAKVSVIGNGSSNGIDTNQFDPKSIKEEIKSELRKQWGIDKDDFVFVYVGRIVKDKGINELIEAFKQISQKFKHAKLLIVGSNDNNLDPISEASNKEIESNPQIIPVGYQKEVKNYFAIANVLAFPSYREGFPNVVMQAAAMELNSIVTDINGCNEIIRDGENGWIVPVYDTHLLYDRMEWCLENREQSDAMGIKGRAIMKEKYERSFVWAEVLKTYQSLKK